MFVNAYTHTTSMLYLYPCGVEGVSVECNIEVGHVPGPRPPYSHLVQGGQPLLLIHR